MTPACVAIMLNVGECTRALPILGPATIQVRLKTGDVAKVATCGYT